MEEPRLRPRFSRCSLYCPSCAPGLAARAEAGEAAESARDEAGKAVVAARDEAGETVVAARDEARRALLSCRAASNSSNPFTTKKNKDCPAAANTRTTCTTFTSAPALALPAPTIE